jgi:hypothetical protein
VPPRARASAAPATMPAPSAVMVRARA